MTQHSSIKKRVLSFECRPTSMGVDRAGKFEVGVACIITPHILRLHEKKTHAICNGSLLSSLILYDNNTNIL